MHKFFLAGSNISKGLAVIRGSDLNHMTVLRMKVGDHMLVCDGNGGEYTCRLSKIESDFAEAEVLGKSKNKTEASIQASIIAGMPKGDRADFIVQKCTELGAADILFFLSERSVSRPDPKALGKRITRWNRIAEEAAKQSGRGLIPRVSAVSGFTEALDFAKKAMLTLFMYETGARLPIKDALNSAGEFDSVSIVTGPEGGFEKYEADIAGHYGGRICSCGPRILRCETAPVAVLAAVMYHTGNM